MTLPAYPGRRTPDSYNGPYVPCECPVCGRRAYLPPSVIDGRTTRCIGCESHVEWERF